MKVALITIHAASNQGACLQAYALQETIIQNFGIEAEILDYHCKKAEEVDYIFNIHAIRSFKTFISQFVYVHRKYIRNQKFKNFRKKFMHLSERYYQTNQMEDLTDQYDVFCVGSDQVWNPNITGSDTAYLLDFITDNNKKVSYASSFGTDCLDSNMKKIYTQELNHFSCIGVRENTAKKLVQEMTGKCAEVVLDPTLLLTKKQWIGLEKKVSVPSSYILVYQIRKSSDLSNYAIQLSKKECIPVLKISDSYLPEKGIKHLKGIGPSEFLFLMANAEWIVTNSFHGTAFAVNFNKDFFVELSPEKLNGNSRIIDFLATIGLESRIIKNRDFLDGYTEIDWNLVNQKLELERRGSVNYLRQALYRNTEGINCV